MSELVQIIEVESCVITSGHRELSTLRADIRDCFVTNVPRNYTRAPLNAKNIKIFFTTLIFSILAAGNLFAQDISFQATIDEDKVSLGSAVQLTLTVEGAKPESPITLPQIDGFESRYLGPSTRVTIVNGKYSSSASYIFNLFPTKVGQFEIPALDVLIDGKNYSTQPIKIEVTDTPTPATSQEEESFGEENKTISLEDKIHLVIEIPKAKLYLYEKLPVVVKLFVQGLPVSDIQYPDFEKTGFTSDEYHEPKQYKQVFNGVTYDVVEFNVDIYPTRTGDITLGPAQLQCNIIYQSSKRRTPFDDFDSFFSNSRFDSFFGGVEKRGLLVKSKPVTLTILPLPEESKPVNFSQAVGKFDFDFSASPIEVKVGDPITIKMKASGEGSLKTISMPAFKEDENFKVYDPQVKEVENGKVLEQVIIAKKETVKSIPPVEFTYFDTNEGKYITLTKGPTAITVKPPAEKEEVKVYQSALPENEKPSETLGRDIVFIKEDFGPRSKIGDRFYNGFLFKLMIILLAILFVAVYALYMVLARVKTDIAFARRLRAPGKAKAGIIKAKGLINLKSQTEFYDLIFKTTQEYFGDKFHLTSSGLTVPEIENILRTKNINADILAKVRVLFSECDEVRFASVKKDKLAMETSLKRCEEVIDYFERSLK